MPHKFGTRYGYQTLFLHAHQCISKIKLPDVRPQLSYKTSRGFAALPYCFISFLHTIVFPNHTTPKFYSLLVQYICMRWHIRLFARGQTWNGRMRTDPLRRTVSNAIDWLLWRQTDSDLSVLRQSVDFISSRYSGITTAISVQRNSGSWSMTDFGHRIQWKC